MWHFIAKLIISLVFFWIVIGDVILTDLTTNGLTKFICFMSAFIAIYSNRLIASLSAEWSPLDHLQKALVLGPHLLYVTLSEPSHICTFQKMSRITCVDSQHGGLAGAEADQCTPRPARKVETRLPHCRVSHE